jgi:YD repeat-containing protein
MIDPTGLTSYEYDALNRLTKITNKGVVTTFTYDALGRRKTMTHGNGVVTTYSYDAAPALNLPRVFTLIDRCDGWLENRWG